MKLAKTIASNLPTSDAMIREIVQEFVDSLPARIEAIERALASDDLAELSRIAHSLKGAGGTAGYDCLFQLGAELEQCADQGERRNASDLVKELKTTAAVLAV